jgi:hypothetical protein
MTETFAEMNKRRCERQKEIFKRSAGVLPKYAVDFHFEYSGNISTTKRDVVIQKVVDGEILTRSIAVALDKEEAKLIVEALNYYEESFK